MSDVFLRARDTPGPKSGAAPPGASSETPPLPASYTDAPELRIAGHRVRPRLGRIEGPRGDTAVEPKVMHLLVCLAREPGAVRTKDELFAEVWTETFVGDEVLYRAISLLRKALGDDARRPRVIRTVPKVGYQLIAPVIREPAGCRPRRPSAALPVPDPRPARRYRAVTGLAASLLLFTAGIGWGLCPSFSLPEVMPWERSQPVGIPKVALR